VDQKILICLARNRGRFCSAAAIAAEIGRPAAEVAAALEDLASRNVLAVRIAEAVLYKLDPASRDARAIVREALSARGAG
jgi:hypothetical protein